MSIDNPVATQVTIRGSVSPVQLSSVTVHVSSFFIQALEGNTGNILIGNVSTVNATTAMVQLSAGEGVEFVASDYKIHSPVFNLTNFHIVATASSDKATLTYFS